MPPEAPTIDAELYARLAAAAETYGLRSVEEMIERSLFTFEAMHGELGVPMRTLGKIDAGIDALERGELIPGKQAFAEIRDRIEEGGREAVLAD